MKLDQFIYDMRELTKAEEQVMQILWTLKKAFVKDILEKMPEPKPAYNTVSTIVRILEKKGFIGYEAFGKTHQYHPIVEKDKYKEFYLKNFVGNYFEGSFKNLVSFFAKSNDLDINEMENLLKYVEKDSNKEENE